MCRELTSIVAGGIDGRELGLHLDEWSQGGYNTANKYSLMSLERFLNLAKKTGDRLIVYDSQTEQGTVLLNIDEYEELLEKNDPTPWEDFEDVRDLSEGELIDKINRDIAIWRSSRELDEQFEREQMLEEQLAETPLDDPFEEDFSHSDEWHQAGALLEKRYANLTQSQEKPLAAEAVPKLHEEGESEDTLRVVPLRSEQGEEEAVEDTRPIDGVDPIFLEEPLDE